MNKKGGFGYILAIVLMVFITVKLIAVFRPVAREFKNLLIITNEQTIHIDENN